MIVVVLYLALGPAPFARTGTTLGAVLGAYFAGGLAAGLVLGLLRPLARWWWGAAIIGSWCAVPIWTAALLAVMGAHRIDDTDIQALALASILTGPLLGVAAWRRSRREGPSRPPLPGE